MKQLFVVMSCVFLLTACANRKPMPAWKPVAPAADTSQLYDAQGIAIERIPFRAGISSVTVEKMAAAQGCVGGQGAGLATPPGPVEVYRMICEGNKVFMARCEFRQCKPMSPPPAGGYSAQAPVHTPIPAPQVAGVVETSPVAAPGGVPQ